MNINRFLQRSSNIFEEKKLLRIGFISVLILTLLNWFNVKELSDKERIVLIPIGASGDLWITSNEASDDYIKYMTRYILKLVGDYTVRTAREQFNDVVRLYKPAYFGEAKTHFDAMTKEIEKFQSAAANIEFTDRDILHDKIGRKVKVNVKKTRYLNGVNSGEEKKNIMIEYDIENGRFWIKQVLEESNDA